MKPDPRSIVGHMARDPRPGPWPVKTAQFLGRPDPHFAGYGRPGPVAGRAMGRFLGPQSACGPVRWPVKPAFPVETVILKFETTGGLWPGPWISGPSGPRADKMTHGPGHGPRARPVSVGDPARAGLGRTGPARWTSIPRSVYVYRYFFCPPPGMCLHQKKNTRGPFARSALSPVVI
jgi:hypothetical protein